MAEANKTRTPAEVARDEAEVSSASTPVKGNRSTHGPGPETTAPQTTVEVTDEDKKFVRKTFHSLSQNELSIRKASTAIGELLFKLLHLATERSVMDVNGVPTPNLDMATAYLTKWLEIGEVDWQKRDLQQRIDEGEVEKGSSALRGMADISGTYVSYKSVMLSGLKQNISPLDTLELLDGEDKALPKYSTFNEYAKASREATKKSRAPRQPKANVTSLGIKPRAPLSPNCEAMIGHMIESIVKLPPEQQDKEIEPLLKGYANTVAGLVNSLLAKADMAAGATPAPSGQIATATTGNPEADAAAAAKIAAQNAAEGGSGVRRPTPRKR